MQKIFYCITKNENFTTTYIKLLYSYTPFFSFLLLILFTIKFMLIYFAFKQSVVFKGCLIVYMYKSRDNFVKDILYLLAYQLFLSFYIPFFRIMFLSDIISFPDRKLFLFIYYSIGLLEINSISFFLSEM